MKVSGFLYRPVVLMSSGHSVNIVRRVFTGRQIRLAVMGAAALGVGVPNTMAADVKVGGFASFVAGRAFNSQDRPAEGDVFGGNGRILTDIYNSFRDGPTGPILNRDARYFEEWSYLPDTNYGVQFRADLGQGLTATALFSSKGASGFDTTLDWGYVRYEMTDNLTIQAGRQLAPLYYYSDFTDVGYAYHWIRVPTNIYRLGFQAYEGASITYTESVQDWDFDFKLYGGTSNNETSVLGDFTFENLVGVELKAHYDWLETRLSLVQGDASAAGGATDRDNPAKATFGSFSAHMNFDPMFVLFEANHTAVQDGGFLDIAYGAFQISHVNAAMISAGFEYGDFTPHITYSLSELNFADDPARPETALLDGLVSSTQTLTLGARWDFHPAAALKMEYEINTDESDQAIIDQIGNQNEIDLLSIGLDIIF